MANNAGLTILELLIAVAVIGVLSVMVVPNVINAKKSANYGAATILVNNLANEVFACALENPAAFADSGGFPADVGPNEKPAGCDNLDWPSQSRIPFNSTIDYENWEVDGGRWIGLTFWGEKNSRTGHGSNSNLGSGFKRYKSDGNITFSIAIQAPH